MFNQLLLLGTIPLFSLLGATLETFAKKVPEVLSEVTLKAQVDKRAIPQVQEAFGKYSIETPEIFNPSHSAFADNHSDDPKHLAIEKDKKMEATFVFRIHRDKDGDRDKVWPEGQERQRNEIKGYQGSPKTMKATHGEVTRYHWYLKIEESFAVTTKFCHFFQLKPVGGKSASDPILTLSGTIVRGKPQLEIRWWTKDGSERTFVADWQECKGKWLECECFMRLGTRGSVRFSVRSSDNAIRFTRKISNLATWRPDYSFIRPKWGIYRSLTNKQDIPNEEDEVRMTNFTIQKLSAISNR